MPAQTVKTMCTTSEKSQKKLNQEKQAKQYVMDDSSVFAPRELHTFADATLNRADFFLTMKRLRPDRARHAQGRRQLNYHRSE